MSGPDIIWYTAALSMSRVVFGRVMRERELWLAAIAGGDTPEETAARFGLDLKVVEMVVRYDLDSRSAR